MADEEVEVSRVWERLKIFLVMLKGREDVAFNIYWVFWLKLFLNVVGQKMGILFLGPGSIGL